MCSLQWFGLALLDESRGIVGAALGWDGSAGQRTGDTLGQRRDHGRAGDDQASHQAEPLSGPDGPDLVEQEVDPVRLAAAGREENDEAQYNSQPAECLVFHVDGPLFGQVRSPSVAKNQVTSCRACGTDR